MKEKIRDCLKKVLLEEKYMIKVDDIKIDVISQQEFRFTFTDGNISVTMSKTSDLEKCVRETLNNYADHHNI